MLEHNEIIAVLMNRDKLSLEEANEQLNYTRELVEDGANPEEVLAQEFGLEPDYIFDILPW